MVKRASFVDLPLIKKDSIEYRSYQVNIAEIAEKESTMVVLSTGLGKTVIAALIAAKRLKLDQDCKVLFLAPSRPLVDQQAKFLRRVLEINADSIVCMTGQNSPDDRRTIWTNAQVIVMTPQALQNDLVRRSYDLAEVSLIIYDEAHRGVGNYAYTFIAEMYEKQRENALSLGITASPGHQAEHIRTVCANLRLVHVEVRDDQSPDVRDYIVSVRSAIRYVTL
ncbi:MAG: DEAD/DEAH box helicase, partial [Candidatus Thorarchaeota archaeon]